MPHTLEVDGNDPIKLRLGHLMKAGIGRNTRIVDQNVDASPASTNLGDHRIQGEAVGDIDHRTHEHIVWQGLRDARPDFVQRCAEVSRVEIGQYNPGPFSCETLRSGKANSAGGSGNHGDLRVQAHAPPFFTADTDLRTPERHPPGA